MLGELGAELGTEVCSCDGKLEGENICHHRNADTANSTLQLHHLLHRHHQAGLA